MGTLPVIIEDTAATTTDTGYNPNRGTTLTRGSGISSKVKELSTEALSDSLQSIHENLNEIFGSIKEVGDFELQEVKLTLDVTAEGGFALIGSAQVGMKGGITLSFKPPNR
uniref:Pepco domain-containing protein n=2 Tax=uncultured Thiotrichaceae bacterium TaxID=298394 RepID=A0A6S6SAW0_9GAMM|nr:MAG: Unknown protein [uncultured Thiotrichaceae bacterium]